MNRRHTGALSLLLLAAACALACGGGGRPSAAQEERPPLGLEEIRRSINGHWVEVPAADGKTKPVGWAFEPSEPKEIEIVDQKIEGETATFLVNLKTRTTPRARNPRSLSGQLRLHYRLESNLVFRQWEIDEIENVSFTYTNEPPPSPAAGAKKGDEDEDSPGADVRRAPPPPPPPPGAKPPAKSGANANAPPPPP